MKTAEPALAGTSKIYQPHDGLFRAVMGNPTHAASVMRALLPPDLAGQLELARLAALPGVLVGDDLDRAESDVLLAVPLRDSSSTIYVVLEHQSSTDRTMPTRMLGYVLLVWKHHRRTHGRSSLLPPVLPLVVYHGTGNVQWKGPTQVQQMIDPQRAAAVNDYLPSFAFRLEDLTLVTETDLRGRQLTDVAFLAFYLFRYAPGNHGTDYLERVLPELQTVLAGPEWRTVFLRYIQSVGETDPEELHKVFAKLGRDVEEAAMTTAQMLEARGEARGEAKGEARAVLTLLEVRNVAVPAAARDRIAACTDLTQLDTWLRRAANATAIEELFA